MENQISERRDAQKLKRNAYHVTNLRSSSFRVYVNVPMQNDLPI